MESEIKDAQGTLVISRSEYHYRDRIRDYNIEIDGAIVGAVASGSTLQVPLSPGPHVLRARIDWSGSPEEFIEILPGEEVKFRVEPSASTFMALFQLFSTKGWLKLTRE